MNYWDKRYASGGTSGCGSIGELREWKWSVIKRYVGVPNNVIDVGCGDMSFWENEILPEGYFGIDSSEVIIERNRSKYPNTQFICSQSSIPIPVVAPVVFCFDMLFHIMDNDVYRRTIQNLCSMSGKYIFIYTWIDNPLRKFWLFKTDRDDYECFRDIPELYSIICGSGFDAMCVWRNESLDRFGAMLSFRKVGT